MDKFIHMKFIKSWLALENLVNKISESNGSMYVFNKPKAKEFELLREDLKQVITGHPLVKYNSDRKEALVTQLSALERVPIKMLTKSFLEGFQVEYNDKGIEDIIQTRNKILHYVELPYDIEKVARLMKILQHLLSKVLCEMVGWDFEKELRSECALKASYVIYCRLI